ncbi:hypothetical protein WMY93_032525 [Mugilogobius chulae]|uniref:Uncharacterized protein n=1 Tax=Mugilogobius chulae TaxID=88201 RepID=A0AAW0MJG8_9GOBI
MRNGLHSSGSELRGPLYGHGGCGTAFIHPAVGAEQSRTQRDQAVPPLFVPDIRTHRLKVSRARCPVRVERARGVRPFSPPVSGTVRSKPKLLRCTQTQAERRKRRNVPTPRTAQSKQGQQDKFYETPPSEPLASKKSKVVGLPLT